MQLSIIIPTKNRAELLKNLLSNIAFQSYPKNLYEVIIIDNGSTDHTKRICKEAKKHFDNLRYIYDSRPGLHVGRNRGLLESRSNIVAYLDDDGLPFPHWIETIVDAFRDHDTMAVCGSVVPFDMDACSKYLESNKEVKGNFIYLWAASCFWEKGISESDMRFRKMDPRAIFGGNCAFRKEVLLECRGFHPDGMPSNLMMYRGDGESYVGKYLAQTRKKCMYYAQASMYHVLDADRLSKKTISYIDFRNGISAEYTLLREKGLKQALEDLLCDLLHSFYKKNRSYGQMKGKSYLIFYYVFYRQVRSWIHKEDYF